MAKEERQTPIDETEVIVTEELKLVLEENEKKAKKGNWFKRIFKRKDKKTNEE